MRRVALISDHASPLAAVGGTDAGGQNVYVAELARHLAERAWDVEVLTRRDDPALPDVVSCGPRVRVVHVAAGPPAPVRKEDLLPYMEDFAGEARRRAALVGYDVVHANFWLSGLVAAEMKRRSGTPFAVTFHALGRVRRQHQGAADRFPAARFAIEDRVVAEADAIVAECPQDRDDLLRLYGADPARIRTVPCGVDTSRFSPVPRDRARAALGLDPDEPIVLQLGRMVPRKGADNAIRGVAALRRRHGIPARLLVVGGESEEPDPVLTPEIGRLREVAEEEGIAGAVEFVGRRGGDSLRWYYSAADVFVTTPWYEPFGLTPLEAMACGTPVVGSRVGGIQFTVVDGETGFLVPPRDPDALADRLACLLRDPALRRAFGERAVRRARDRFSWSGVAAAVDRTYGRILRAAEGAPRPVPTRTGTHG